MSFYIYAETAFHHEGNKEYLLSLLNQARESGVSGVKFQVLIELDQLMSTRHSSYEMAKGWILSLEDWREVFRCAEGLGLDIIMMPVDLGAFALAREFKIKYLEIHSVSFKDRKMLSELDNCHIPVIFGVGGRNLDEITEVVNRYREREIVLMVGFQAFPSQIEDLRIGKIRQLKTLFPECEIGYADHSAYDDDMAVTSNEYAYLLGARLFEKHITLQEGVERIDYQSAISSKKIAAIVKKLNYLDNLLDVEDVFEMTDAEIVYRNRQKVPVAKYDLSPGYVVTLDDIELKMIDTTDMITESDSIVNRKLKKSVPMDRPFYETDIL